MRVFVTGGGGFLGRHLIAALRGAGHAVDAPSSKECDLLQRGSLAAWAGQPYDQIFHLAAWTQAGDFCLRHPGEQWVRNQLLNTHVLEWWAERQPKAKLISIGTSCAYAPDQPLREEHYLEGEPIGEPLHLRHDQAHALRRAVLAGQAIRAEAPHGGALHALWSRPHYADGRQMHFIFDLIRKILLGQRDGTPGRPLGRRA